MLSDFAWVPPFPCIALALAIWFWTGVCVGCALVLIWALHWSRQWLGSVVVALALTEVSLIWT